MAQLKADLGHIRDLFMQLFKSWILGLFWGGFVAIFCIHIGAWFTLQEPGTFSIWDLHHCQIAEHSVVTLLREILCVDSLEHCRCSWDLLRAFSLCRLLPLVVFGAFHSYRTWGRVTTLGPLRHLQMADEMCDSFESTTTTHVRQQSGSCRHLRCWHCGHTGHIRRRCFRRMR